MVASLWSSAWLETLRAALAREEVRQTAVALAVGIAVAVGLVVALRALAWRLRIATWVGAIVGTTIALALLNRRLDGGQLVSLVNQWAAAARRWLNAG